MTETLVFLVGVFVALAVSYGFGRWLGGRWVVIFIVLMGVGGALLLVSAMNATHANAGMGEALAIIFLWIPLFVCGLIGGIIGWVVRVYAKPVTQPPPVP